MALYASLALRVGVRWPHHPATIYSKARLTSWSSSRRISARLRPSYSLRKCRQSAAPEGERQLHRADRALTNYGHFSKDQDSLGKE